MTMATVFGDVQCAMTDDGAGGFRLDCRTPLRAHRETLIDVLRSWVEIKPDQPLFREADGAEIGYGEALTAAEAIAAGLLDLGASAERPVALVAENSIKAALIILGCYAAGVPVAPISSAYSRMSSDYRKLRYVVDRLAPALIVFDDGAVHRGAITSLADVPCAIVAFGNAMDDVLGWRDLSGGDGTRLPSPDADAPAKILFTSGSTGMPKGVINTHRMMVSNQQALSQIWPMIGAQPLRLADWLPWNHTFGGNQNFNMTLFHGGTMTIDAGKPVADLVSHTIAAIKATRPTLYFNVPRGLDVLVGAMRGDEDLQHALFENLELLGYAGAALPGPIWSALKDMARRVKGRDIPVVSLWGSTETGPVATAVYFDTDDPANIGLPVPGCAMKFVKDAGGKLEMRVKAPSVTPGYWGEPEATTKAFDGDGFFRIGDAGKLADAADFTSGILFDGRLGENFKLTSGTWVNVGALRVALIAACPDSIADAVIAGHNADFVAAMIFPKPGLDLDSQDARREVADALAQHNKAAGGSSQRIRRAVLLREPPSVDGGEITDKGYLNQRAVLDRRGDMVRALYAAAPPSEVLEIG